MYTSVVYHLVRPDVYTISVSHYFEIIICIEIPVVNFKATRQSLLGCKLRHFNLVYATYFKAVTVSVPI